MDILFSRFNFLLPVSENDKFITLADINSIKRYNVIPSKVTSTYAKNLFIYIKSLGTTDLELRFSNANEAFLALQQLQEALEKFGQNNNQQGNLSDADKTYIHNTINYEIGKTKITAYFDSSMTWSIPHSFGSVSTFYINNPTHRPSVSLIDDDGCEIKGYVDYVDVNNIVIFFSQPVSGWAYLN